MLIPPFSSFVLDPVLPLIIISCFCACVWMCGEGPSISLVFCILAAWAYVQVLVSVSSEGVSCSVDGLNAGQLVLYPRQSASFFCSLGTRGTCQTSATQ